MPQAVSSSEEFCSSSLAFHRSGPLFNLRPGHAGYVTGKETLKSVQVSFRCFRSLASIIPSVLHIYSLNL